MKPTELKCLKIDWDFTNRVFDDFWRNSQSIYIIPVDALSPGEREELCWEGIPWHTYDYLIAEL